MMGEAIISGHFFMTKILDEIHEELKREDFLKKFFRVLAIAGICAVFLLMGVALKTWMNARREEALYEREHVFLSSIEILEKTDATSQEKKDAEEVLKTSVSERDGMETLSSLYLLKEAHSAQEIKDFFAPYSESVEIMNFLSAAMALKHIDTGGAGISSSEDKKFSEYYKKSVAWRPMVLLYDALAEYCTVNPQGGSQLLKGFSQWESKIEANSRGYWLFLYTALGAGVSRTFQEKDQYE